MRIIYLIALIYGNQLLADTQEYNFTKGKLFISNNAGNVKIIGSTKGKLKVTYSKRKWDKGCRVEINQEKNEFKIEVKSDTGLLNRSKCQTDFDITAPSTLAKEIRIGAGNMTIEKTTGDLNYKVGAGNIIISDVKNEALEGNIGSGNTDIKGAFKLINLIVGSGRISGVLGKYKSQTGITIKSGTGNVSLEIPKRTTAKVSYKSGVGSLENKTQSSKKPDFNVNVRAGVGGLKIGYF